MSKVSRVKRQVDMIEMVPSDKILGNQHYPRTVLNSKLSVELR